MLLVKLSTHTAGSKDENVTRIPERAFNTNLLHCDAATAGYTRRDEL